MDQRAHYFLPFAILVAILAVSTASIFIRFAQNDGVPSFVIAALRLTFATAILAPIALSKHREELKRLTPDEILLCGFSGIFLALHFATWISSLEYTSVASSVVFVSTGPLWVALLAPLFLKEHLARTAIIGLGLALAGGTIIGLSDACVWDAWIILSRSTGCVTRSRNVRKLPGIARRIDRDWLSHHRQKITCEGFAYPLYFYGVRICRRHIGHHHARFWQFAIWVCAENLRLDLFAGGASAIDRTFHL